MTFDARETSLDDGQPIGLYLFERGLTKWGFCSADRDITFDSVVYRALVGGITDDGVRHTGDADADALEIVAPGDLAPAQFHDLE